MERHYGGLLLMASGGLKIAIARLKQLRRGDVGALGDSDLELLETLERIVYRGALGDSDLELLETLERIVYRASQRASR